jgi:predicted nucleic acid-binding protein
VAVVSNSSPLIALTGIQRLDLLPAIFESVLIPPAVAREIAPSIPILPTWLRMQAPNALPPASLPRRRLGDGEWEAMALAIELKAAWIILDDLPARRSAEATGLNVIGTLGTLLTAKRRACSSRFVQNSTRFCAHRSSSTPSYTTNSFESPEKLTREQPAQQTSNPGGHHHPRSDVRRSRLECHSRAD